MENLSGFQKEFMETLADIQENCVQIALSQKDNQSLESSYYDITSETIIRIMELIDGYSNRYSNQNVGRLKVVCEKSGESLKDNPYIELHDVVCNYLKGVD